MAAQAGSGYTDIRDFNITGTLNKKAKEIGREDLVGKPVKITKGKYTGSTGISVVVWTLDHNQEFTGRPMSIQLDRIDLDEDDQRKIETVLTPTYARA